MRLGWLTAPLLPMVAAFALAQVAPAPDAPPAEIVQSSAGAPLTRADLQSMKDAVNLYFVARSGHDRLVPDLTSADCSITEDSVEQTVQSFTAGEKQPLNVGILLDASLAEQRSLPLDQQALAAFLPRLLQRGDEAFAISFDVNVDLLSDLTGSRRKLQRAVESAGINSSTGNYANGTLPPIGKAKGTLLYDAIYLAANMLRHEPGRKVLIVLTSGVDQGSRKNRQEAIETAQRANAAVYVVLARDGGIDGVLEDSAGTPVRKVAEATGGRLFNTGGNGRKIQAALDEITAEVRGGYRAGYTPAAPAAAGAYRSVRVICRKNGKWVHVQVRQGVYGNR